MQSWLVTSQGPITLHASDGLLPQLGATALTLVTWFGTMPAGSLRGLVLACDDLDAEYQRLLSGGNGLSDVNQPVWRNRTTIGQELARVVEDDDAVAQQVPPLLGVQGDDVGRVTVRAVSCRT